MENVTKTVEDSAFPLEVKTELKALVTSFVTLQANEVNTLSEMLKAKSGVNERQYSKRLSEPMSDEKRNDVLVNQYAYRAWFANTVMRIHELRLHLRLLSNRLLEKINHLSSHHEPSSQVALVAMARLIRERDYSNPDAILSELDNVSDITRERILQAVTTIFKAQLEGKGIFGTRHFSSTHIEFAQPTPAQDELADAIKPAIEVRERFEDLWSDYYPVRSRWNVPQFTKRLEEALTQADMSKVEQIRKERLQVEAHLFIVASRWASAYPELISIIERLRPAIRKVAESITDDGSLASLKAMSHCIGAWHWLGELTGYITDKYNGCKVESTLAELDFDAPAYINAKT